MSKSPKNTIFGSKTAISRPLINLKINTFNIKPTPKIFLALYTTPTNSKSSYKNPGSLLKMWYSVTQCPTYGPIIAAIAVLLKIRFISYNSYFEIYIYFKIRLVNVFACGGQCNAIARYFFQKFRLRRAVPFQDFRLHRAVDRTFSKKLFAASNTFSRFSPAAGCSYCFKSFACGGQYLFNFKIFTGAVCCTFSKKLPAAG